LKTCFACLSAILLTFALTACSESPAEGPKTAADNPKKSYRSEEAIKSGDVVDLHGKISNLDTFERFIGNVESGVKDTIRITRYTVEGDPIFYHFDYNGETLQYTYDNSQDTYAGSDKGQQSTNCLKMEGKDGDNGVEFRLSGCSSEEVGNTFSITVEK
jgi:hypothetical protein